MPQGRSRRLLLPNRCHRGSACSAVQAVAQGLETSRPRRFCEDHLYGHLLAHDQHARDKPDYYVAFVIAMPHALVSGFLMSWISGFEPFGATPLAVRGPGWAASGWSASGRIRPEADF